MLPVVMLGCAGAEEAAPPLAEVAASPQDEMIASAMSAGSETPYAHIMVPIDAR